MLFFFQVALWYLIHWIFQYLPVKTDIESYVRLIIEQPNLCLSESMYQWILWEAVWNTDDWQSTDLGVKFGGL